MKKFKRYLKVAWALPFALLFGLTLLLLALFAFLAVGKRGLELVAGMLD